MKLLVLPRGHATAAENMAQDSLLLESFAEPAHARVRFYGWARPSFTFGYSQPWAPARATAGNADLVRRATGGGLVDHRNDWTYALVAPPAHPLSQADAAESYKIVHEALAAALRQAGCPVAMSPCKPPPRPLDLSVCFEKPERFDLVRAGSSRKIAGAAQKRNRSGLLLQGSVDRLAAPEVMDWEALGQNFAEELGRVFGAKTELWNHQPWPADKLAEAAAKFSSVEWNERR